MASESSQRLARYAKRDTRLRIRGEHGETITLPASAVRVLVSALSELAAGNAVTVIASDSELTTQQAAEAIGVSRPFLVALLDEGKIPFRKVGSHRRVLLRDLIAYRRKNDRRRRKTLNQLAAQAQQLSLGY